MNGVEAEIGLCLLLSAADGEISEAELFALTTRVGHLLGDDFPVTRLEGLVEGELRSIEELGADGYVAKLPQRIAPERRFEALRAACKVACADGLSPEEEEMVREACTALEVDVNEVVDAVGYRKTVAVERASTDDEHQDEPNAMTAHIVERLGASGWSDPMKELRDAGIVISGFGAVALIRQSANGSLLRVEHHTCDGSIHFHVTDESDNGADFVLLSGGREDDVLDALVAMQDDLTLADAERRLASLSSIVKVCIRRDGELVEITR